MGGELNRVHIVHEGGVEHLEEMPKDQVAQALIARIAEQLEQEPQTHD